MKLLYLFNSAESSVAIVTLNQVKALRKFYPELDIKIACVNYYPERSVLEGEIDYKKTYNSNQIINYIQSFLFVRKVKKIFKPDITISNMSTVNSFNAIIDKKDLKIGIFHAANTQLKNRNFFTRIWNRISLNYFFNKLDVIIGISQNIVDDFRLYNLKPKIKLFYNIHDIKLIESKASKPLDVMFSLKDSVEVLILGTIDRNKRQDLILKALMNDSKKNIKVYIVGKVMDQNYFNELESYVVKYSLKKQVTFIPFLENPYPLINRVDMLISLSESEGLPGVLIESLTLNTPVITTNSSKGVWEINNNIINYQRNLDDLFVCDKGIIIPNPIQYNDEKMAKFIEKAIKIIEYNKLGLKTNKFLFQEKIDDNSIHTLYQFLKTTFNETNN